MKIATRSGTIGRTWSASALGGVRLGVWLGACLVASTSATGDDAQAANSILNPAAEVSVIAIPIRASLRPLLPLLEARVPASASRTDRWEIEPRGQFAIKYRVVREPIVLNMIGNGLHATTTIRYALEACRRTTNPFSGETVLWPCVSCGFTEPMRRAGIALTSRLEWDANWRLRSITKARPADFPDRCRVTMARVDITDWKIGPEVNRQLQEVVRTIDSNTPALTALRLQAASVWSSLQDPVAVGPRRWLLIEPGDVAFTPIQGTGLEVTSTLMLRARTRVVVADAVPAVSKKPLPSLGGATQQTNGIRVPVRIELPYDEASRLLTETLGHRRYGDLAVGDIALSRARDGKVLVRLDVDYRVSALRKYRGSVDLEGTPVYEPSTRTVALTALDYTLDRTRRSLFLSIADRMAHNALREQLARNAHWPIGAQLEVWRSEIAHSLTRPLGQGAMMSGSVTSLEPAIDSIGEDAIVLRVIFVGNAEVRLPSQ